MKIHKWSDIFLPALAILSFGVWFAKLTDQTYDALVTWYWGILLLRTICQIRETGKGE